LLKSPLIESVGGAGNPIGNNDIGSTAFEFERNNGTIEADARMVQTFYVDPDYLHTLQIPLVKGRNFSEGHPADLHSSVLVNETLVRQMGWTEALGKKLRMRTGPGNTVQDALVIGVVKDFSIYSLQHKIEPLVLLMPPVPKEDDNCYVRLSKADIPAALHYIESIYKELDPDASFEYNFLDENFERQYAAEEHEGRLLIVFTALAIFIACLGLFGLVTFAVEQRTKEIGIRRVLGASTTGIVSMVSKDLIRPVMLAILIATPIAWYILHKWLQEFAYRVSITVTVFAGAGLLALLIAVVTVGVRARRAARVPPAKSLRTE